MSGPFTTSQDRYYFRNKENSIEKKQRNESSDRYFEAEMESVRSYRIQDVHQDCNVELQTLLPVLRDIILEQYMIRRVISMSLHYESSM